MFKPSDIDFLSKHINAICNHWTAGNYSMCFNHYHFCITYDGKMAHVKQVRSLYSVGSHIWKRNTGKIGISLCAMGQDKHGKTIYPVEDHQVEVMAKLIAELCFIFEIDIDGNHLDNEKYYDKKNETLVNTGRLIEFPNVTDHAYYAKKDGYSAWRWDIGNLEPIVKPKAKWYFAKLKSGEHEFDYTKNLY